LTDNHHYDAMHAWSSDGGLLAFISERDGYSAVYVTAVDGTPPRRLTTSSSLNPSFSH
jgi:Tol biopolymer transport system component